MLSACAGPHGGAPPETPSGSSAPAERAKSPLEAGLSALESSRYEEAERALRKALATAEAEPEATDEDRGAALVGVARTLLLTGRGEEASRFAQMHASGAKGFQAALLTIAAEALRRRGQLDEALHVLDGAPSEAKGPARASQLEVALLRGEILLERGQRAEATRALLPIIEAYNDERIGEADGRSLAVVGRAAYLLRSPHDANDAFDEAERAAPGDVRTLLWRAELYLDKYDLAHADEVVSEALERAPQHPQALVWKAHVRLGQALDFDEAERLARAALQIDQTLADAYFVLGGIALRDEEIAEAEKHATAGLRYNPRHLDLLSLRATARFLADDSSGFERLSNEVLTLNPEFTRLFQIIGEFADWEHRYDEIVRLMRRATRIDPEDGRSRAQLGLNLIRAGQDAAGVVELRRAFDADPFNVRVFNTLELYEKVIPRDYEQVRSGRFLIRYPKKERALLERYVPDLLERAYAKMVGHYGFEPEAPIGIELYETREQFAVRTSGLPQTGIQGVCFGRTLATMSLSQEPFNLGMTLWHELAHVFHIQLSKSRVPRWFTEGVAELETVLERPEWSRELDPQLYQALRAGRLPEVARMSRAFTRAEHMEDVGTAYYASSQIATYLANEYGTEPLAAMLRAWGNGQTAPQAISGVLALTPEQLDDGFRGHLRKELRRFDDQFVPRRYRGDFQARKEAAEEDPADFDAQLAFALALFDGDQQKQAESRIRDILKRAPDHADARFSLGRIQLAKGDPKAGEKTLEALIAKSDGFEPRMLLARLARARDDSQPARTHLEKAHRFDPRAAEPLVRLAELHNRAGDEEAELAALRLLAPLEEHAGPVHRRFLELLSKRALWAEAVQAGEAAIWTNLSDARMHLLFAGALEATGHGKRALFELESASHCATRPDERAAILEELAKAYERQGQVSKARDVRRTASQLQPAEDSAAP